MAYRKPSQAQLRREHHASVGVTTADQIYPAPPSKPPSDKTQKRVIETQAQINETLERIVQRKQELARASAQIIFLDAAEKVAARMVKMAMGEIKGATPTNQLEAGKVVLQYSGIDIQKALRDGKKPLGEYTLTELESHLNAIRDQVSMANAIPGESEPISD